MTSAIWVGHGTAREGGSVQRRTYALARGLNPQKHESRAVRGFEYGGPSRTRTYDQGIMSPYKRPLSIESLQ